MIHSIIERVDMETPTTVSILFPWDQDVLPGQFVMLWIPGVGEIPISLSHTGRIKGITVKKFGPTSTAITELKAGDRIFFRGPYGNTFRKTEGKTLIVGGGSGMAGLLPLITQESHGVVSARTKEELLFADRFSQEKLTIVTDDGSMGTKGFAVEGLKTLDLDEFSLMYICGPELMLKSILDYIADKEIDADFSLERHMKCGIGVCDSCSMDGLQLCTQGPVFPKSALLKSDEFGKERISISGKRVRL
jgi:dihydroorotate dehydrogenase electron transfer subunit